jgi:uncharacterized protein (TIGR02147 family)
MRELTEYTDYRAYLRDWLAERKEAGLPASNRWFAMKMGVNSTSWLTTLLSGGKNLSKESANRLSALIKHDSHEARFFETLVFFNQARSLDERNRYYQELAGLRNSRRRKTLAPDQFDFYARWYHSAVRSLVGMHGFDGDYGRLGAAVSPAITAAQARESIDLLERLNLIRKTAEGSWELSDSAISSGEKVRSLAVANFQTETMRLAQEALDRYRFPDRDITTVTVGVSQESWERIRAVMAEARAKVIEIANGDSEADRVYQINMQGFPLSKAPQKSRAADSDKGHEGKGA